MIDCSLSESRVVKLAINVVLNVLTQTRSLVASRLIEDDTHWDCTAQGTANRMRKSSVYGHYFKIKPDATDILSVLSTLAGIHSQHKPRVGALSPPSPQTEVSLAQLQPHFDLFQDQPSFVLASEHRSKLHSTSLLR